MVCHLTEESWGDGDLIDFDGNKNISENKATQDLTGQVPRSHLGKTVTFLNGKAALVFKSPILL